ncbi:MAG TPA: hypothetical protein PKW98_16610 [Candidatus Wallbacteria bacterium]|nr:MAG: hypothetical protein BWY32_01640 [bacterium ADurb.Bin243]HOD39010.1 hypothetical protein [Candidatus Wallbacteria bacterium]HPG59444.1 hypothetical protein [Candidatus Wallbacteria bacterium]
MKSLKFKQLHIIYLFLSVSLVTFAMAGCSGSSDSSSSAPNYLFTERYNAPEVISYIDKYGNDFEKTQAIEAGRVYETMTWRSKGVAIKYLYDTGQIVKEDHFSTYSTQR